MRLRSQVSLLLLTLIVTAIAATAGVLIYQSKVDITRQIFTDSRNFGELSSSRIVDLTNEYLPSQSFVIFRPLMHDLLRKNNDLNSIQVYTFAGELTYDSATEAKEQYLGSKRPGVSDQAAYLERIQNQNPSFLSMDGQITYINKDNQGNYSFVNKEGGGVSIPDTGAFQVRDFVFPVANENAVLYSVSYDNLAARIQQSAINIGIVGVAAILLSIIIGLIFAGTLTKPLARLTTAVSKIAAGDLNQKVKSQSQDEVGILSQAVTKMAADLKKSIAAQVFKEKTEKELELAAKIQQELLPKEVPDLEFIDVAAQLRPAAKVSGDAYDFITVNNQNGNYMYTYIADVTGHGISASLLSSTANAMIAMLAPEEPDPVRLLSKVNQTLKAKTSGTVFITLALIKFDIAKKKLTYVNAGHEQLIKYNAKTKEVELLPPGGIALGMLPEIADQLKEEEIKLQAGDSILLYSDGLPEAWKNKKEQYGFDKLQATYRKHASLQTAAAIQKAVFSDVDKFRANYEQQDDMTAIVVKK